MNSFKIETSTDTIFLDIPDDTLQCVKHFHPRSIVVWSHTDKKLTWDHIPAFKTIATLSGDLSIINMHRSQFSILYNRFRISEILLHHDKNRYQLIVKTSTKDEIHYFDLIEIISELEYQPPVKCNHCGIGEIGGGSEYLKAKQQFESLQSKFSAPLEAQP